VKAKTPRDYRASFGVTSKKANNRASLGQDKDKSKKNGCYRKTRGAKVEQEVPVRKYGREQGWPPPAIRGAVVDSDYEIGGDHRGGRGKAGEVIRARRA